jgi:phosphatidylinositol-3-phosphatase
VSHLDFPLPPMWARVLLVLVFLGFGVLVGSITSNPGGTPVASAQPHLRLVLPSAGALASTRATSSTPTPASSSVPPPAAAETTPEASTPAPASTTTSKTAASKQSARGSGGGGSGSGSGSSSGGGGSGAGQAGSGSGAGGEGSSGAAGAGKLPPVKHVFLIVLADQPYAAVFGPASKAAYLSHTLERRGELLVRYYAVAHDELANGIALLSGQGPTAQTAANCPTYAAIAPATAGAQEQVTGQGCVYPKSTETLAGQLAAKHLAWRAYLQGMSAACAHPALGAADPTVGPAPAPAPAPATTPGAATSGAPAQPTPANQAAAGAEYTTFRNPLLYFSSIIDSAPACAAADVGLGQLSADLKSAKSTPALSYIVPSLCDDGSPTPCAPGKPAGLAPADAFLQKVVPQILASNAYKNGGLLAITVDQAPATGIEADSSSCCAQPRFPGLPAPAGAPAGAAGGSTASGELPPSGGGQVGALLLSRFVKADSVDQDPYNHFSLLRTIEDLFGLKHLGYAGANGVNSFNAAVFEGASG